MGGWGGPSPWGVGVCRGQVIDVAPSLDLCLEDTVAASQVIGHGRQLVECYSWLQMQVLQQCSQINWPRVIARPPHDEAHHPGRRD